jgi:hypothetical protein
MISVAFNLALEIISVASDCASAMVFFASPSACLIARRTSSRPIICTYGALASDEEFMMITS